MPHVAVTARQRHNMRSIPDLNAAYHFSIRCSNFSNIAGKAQSHCREKAASHLRPRRSGVSLPAGTPGPRRRRQVWLDERPPHWDGTGTPELEEDPEARGTSPRITAPARRPSPPRCEPRPSQAPPRPSRTRPGPPGRRRRPRQRADLHTVFSSSLRSRRSRARPSAEALVVPSWPCKGSLTNVKASHHELWLPDGLDCSAVLPVRLSQLLHSRRFNIAGES